MSKFTPPRECPCWTKSHCRYHDSESSDHAPCCPIQVHNDAHERERLRADLAAALKAKEEACDLALAVLGKLTTMGGER